MENQYKSRSNNKYDVFKWIERCIDSCVTKDQVKSSYNLIHQFNTIYDDRLLSRPLYSKFEDKYFDIFKKSPTVNVN